MSGTTIIAQFFMSFIKKKSDLSFHLLKAYTFPFKRATHTSRFISFVFHHLALSDFWLAVIFISVILALALFTVYDRLTSSVF